MKSNTYFKYLAGSSLSLALPLRCGLLLSCLPPCLSVNLLLSQALCCCCSCLPLLLLMLLLLQQLLLLNSRGLKATCKGAGLQEEKQSG